MENSWKVYFKTVTGEETYTILQNQSLELVTTVIIINVVIDGFSGEGLMIGSYNCPITPNCPITTFQINRPRSSMAPRLLGQNLKFFSFRVSLDSQKRFRCKESNTKYKILPESLGAMLEY